LLAPHPPTGRMCRGGIRDRVAPRHSPKLRLRNGRTAAGRLQRAAFVDNACAGPYLKMGPAGPAIRKALLRAGLLLFPSPEAALEPRLVGAALVGLTGWRLLAQASGDSLSARLPAKGTWM